MPAVEDTRRSLPHVRAAGWLQEHSVAGNAIIVTLLAPVPVLLSAAAGIHVLFLLVLLVPLYLRASRPAAAACLFAALILLGAVVLRVWPFAIGVWAAPWLMHAVASRCRRPTRRGVLALALLTCLVCALLWPRWWLNPALDGTGVQVPFADWLIGAVVLLLLTALVMIAAHLAGDLRRTTLERRQAELDRADALAERARRLEVERDQEIRLAAHDERTRIAREMHDVVAHSLSVVIAQADGARYAARSDPGAAEIALVTIAESARGSLAETRRLLGVLRTDEPAERAPVPGLADLPELLESVRATGLPIRCRGLDEMPELPSGASLAIYRLVQEALTNTLKHSPGASGAEVELRADARGAEAVVSSDGLGASGRTAAGRGHGGHGLLGLRERFELYGGSLDAGPDPRDPTRWAVRGRLPGEALDPEPVSAAEDAGAAGAPWAAVELVGPGTDDERTES